MEAAAIAITSREVSRGLQTETVAARDLWTFLEVKADYSVWLFGQLDRYELVADEDYCIEKRIVPVATDGIVRNNIVVEYHLTLEAAKELSMAQANSKGRICRKYFIDCERAAKKAAAEQAAKSKATQTPIDPMQVLADPAALRSILLNYSEKLLTAEAVIAEQTPKVQALARIAEARQGSMCITDAAKNLQMSPGRLFGWLSTNRWIYRRSGTDWLAYQPRIEEGVLEHKCFTAIARNTEDKIVQQVRVTPKGLARLSEIFSPGDPSSQLPAREQTHPEQKSCQAQPSCVDAMRDETRQAVA